MEVRQARNRTRSRALALLGAAAALLLATAAIEPAPAVAAKPDPIPTAVRARFGKPIALEKARGRVGQAARELIDLIGDTYGVDASRTPVYVLTARAMRGVHRLISGTRANDRVRAFEYRGVVYINEEQVELKETLAHELLHALSQRFSSEASARGHRKFVEGVTQYLTMSTGVSEELGSMGVRRRGTAYGMYVRFAQRVADVVGDDVLAQCYFARGFDALERALDREVGGGRTARAIELLENDDYGGALRALGEGAVHPFDRLYR